MAKHNLCERCGNLASGRYGKYCSLCFPVVMGEQSKARWSAKLSTTVSRGVKVCSKCSLEKPFSEFYKRTDNIGKLKSWCISCEKEKGKTKRSKLWAKKSQARRKGSASERVIKARYESKQYSYLKGGFSLDTTAQIIADKYEAQGKQCAVCSRPLPFGGGESVLDHDHAVKKHNFRGFLCRKCNWGLGNFLDNIDLLKSAIDYLSGWQEQLSERIVDSTVLVQ